jgi:hypothetical protein
MSLASWFTVGARAPRCPEAPSTANDSHPQRPANMELARPFEYCG